MKTVMLKNKFHGNEFSLRIPCGLNFDEYYDDLSYQSEQGNKFATRRLRDIDNKSCGMKDCRCWRPEKIK